MKYAQIWLVSALLFVGCGGSSQPSLEGKYVLDVKASRFPNVSQDMKAVPYLRFAGTSKVLFCVNGAASDEMAATYELKDKLIRVFPEEYVRPMFFGIDGTLYKEGMAIEWELKDNQIVWAQKGRPGQKLVFNRVTMPAPTRPK